MQLPSHLKDGIDVHFAAEYANVFSVAFPPGPVVVLEKELVPASRSVTRSDLRVTVSPSWFVAEPSRVFLPFPLVTVVSAVPDLPSLVL